MDETFTSFFDNLGQAGLLIPSSVRNKLEVRLSHLEQEVAENLETLSMGDFWFSDLPYRLDIR